jgi:hypothetical protein
MGYRDSPLTGVEECVEKGLTGVKIGDRIRIEQINAIRRGRNETYSRAASSG